jgi:hypothetical protein
LAIHTRYETRKTNKIFLYFWLHTITYPKIWLLGKKNSSKSKNFGDFFFHVCIGSKSYFSVEIWRIFTPKKKKKKTHFLQQRWKCKESIKLLLWELTCPRFGCVSGGCLKSVIFPPDMLRLPDSYGQALTFLLRACHFVLAIRRLQNLFLQLITYSKPPPPRMGRSQNPAPALGCHLGQATYPDTVPLCWPYLPNKEWPQDFF